MAITTGDKEGSCMEGRDADIILYSAYDNPTKGAHSIINLHVVQYYFKTQFGSVLYVPRYIFKTFYGICM